MAHTRYNGQVITNGINDTVPSQDTTYSSSKIDDLLLDKMNNELIVTELPEEKIKEHAIYLLSSEETEPTYIPYIYHDGEWIVFSADAPDKMNNEHIVDELPIEDIKEHTIYLLESESSDPTYTPYIYYNDEWIVIGGDALVDIKKGLEKDSFTNEIGIKFTEMTQAEWDEVEEEEKEISGFVKITDGEATPETLIDDTEESLVKTYSSTKIEEKLNITVNTVKLEGDIQSHDPIIEGGLGIVDAVKMTQDEYDALGTYDENRIYVII